MMRDVRCPSCKRLLCRVEGQGTTIEVKCGNRICDRIVTIGADGEPQTSKKPAPIARAS